MHLIPATSSHWHILVSVFPSVGLAFAVAVFIAGLVTDNETMKRSCLWLFALLGLLAIPTYLSGLGSMAALAGSPRVLQSARDAHYAWSMWALASLALTGVAAAFALLRSRGAAPVPKQMLYAVLSLAALTLALMVVVGELGWQTNHSELRLAVRQSTGISASDVPEDQGTPQTWSHIHMILNHFPTVGFVLGLALFIAALVRDNDGMKRVGLVIFTLCAILGAPTFVTGAAAMWALTDPPVPGISMAAINAHRDLAILTLFGLGLTGCVAWIELWRYRYLARFSNLSLYLVLTLAVVTLGIMAETGHRGGQINHPEIRTEPLPADGSPSWSPGIENAMNDVIWFVPWQTVHFFGYSLVFGTVLVLVLRVLGVWKSMPFSAVHRILPLGVFGVTMNIFSGMLMLMADTFRYANETTFAPKMFFLPVGAIAVLYFSLSERVWNVKAGQDAPLSAKLVAALVLISWTIVIIGGRLLPYV